MMVNRLPEDDIWFINGRLIPDQGIIDCVRRQRRESTCFVQAGQIVLAFIKRRDLARVLTGIVSDVVSSTTFAGFPTDEIVSDVFSYPWELVNCTAVEIERDFVRLKKSRKFHRKSGGGLSGIHILNKKDVVIGKDSVLKPGAVLDATRGPIIIGSSATVMSNAVIEGPAFIGNNSIIKAGARIYHGTSIGAHCKVGGEVEASVIQGFSNKQHDGFLGHSYLGSWVNIGADTNTSDLKNTYGTVKVYINGSQVDSESQFVGLYMGDHSKTGINTMFNSGTVAGVSCNVYGAGFPPKFIPSFSWGEPGELVEYDLEKSLETARRVMARRDVELTPAYEKIYRNVFHLTEHERRAAGH
jgi:UDP-N-acetylglucosamine diphosphorylase/glucosamine-1-phosphate N-acetyltransferase